MSKGKVTRVTAGLYRVTGTDGLYTVERTPAGWVTTLPSGIATLPMPTKAWALTYVR